MSSLDLTPIYAAHAALAEARRQVFGPLSQELALHLMMMFPDPFSVVSFTRDVTNKRVHLPIPCDNEDVFLFCAYACLETRDVKTLESLWLRERPRREKEIKAICKVLYRDLLAQEPSDRDGRRQP